MKRIIDLYRKCKLGHSNFLIVVLRFFYYNLKGKKIIAHQQARIKGVKNLVSEGILRIGTDYNSFVHKKDVTFLNIRGKLIIDGDYTIGRGCRISIADNAVLKIGKGGFINVNTLIQVEHEVTIGDDCAIGWDCQILDEDFHTIEYSGYTPKPAKVNIGNHVWIGSRANIYSGTSIPNNCVIAANSVVRGIFTEENSLIGGNPAKVIRTGVNWK